MPLSDVAIRAAKPRDNAYKMFDERGLFLLVTATGSKLWRFKYRFDGREKLLSFGSFPDVPLRVARDKRDEARRTLSAAEPMDPSVKRQAERAARADTCPALDPGRHARTGRLQIVGLNGRAPRGGVAIPRRPSRCLAQPRSAVAGARPLLSAVLGWKARPASGRCVSHPSGDHH